MPASPALEHKGGDPHTSHWGQFELFRFVSNLDVGTDSSLILQIPTPRKRPYLIDMKSMISR